MKFKWHILLTACIILLGASGCLKNRFSVTIDLQTPDSRTSNTYRMLYYASDDKKGWITETAITVTAGKGKEELITRNPTIVWIFRGGNKPITAFYAERGDDIEIIGKSADPLDWEIKGNELTEEWSKWRLENVKTLRSGNAKAINAAIKKYVEAHKDGQLSTVLMLTTFNRYADESLFVKLWNMIDEDAKEPKLLTAIGRADQLTGSKADSPQAIKQLQLHTSADTIIERKMQDAGATVLYLWHGDDYSRPQDFDTLRTLYKKYRADSRLQIIDIMLDRDTMSWSSRLGTDSLKAPSTRWLHAWAPGGEMHSSIEKLRVRHTPATIVLDSRGAERFRGESVSKAAGAAEKVLGSPKDTLKR